MANESGVFYSAQGQAPGRASNQFNAPQAPKHLQQSTVSPAEHGPAPFPIRPVINLYKPDLSGNERKYVLECVDSSWISSNGAFVRRFEQAFAEITEAYDAITVSNGTVALHLALHALGIGPGDEVIVPTFTYIASVNTIAQTGATPVFADSCLHDWLLDPVDVARKITPRTKAIMAVHLYGAVCDMAALCALARQHGLLIVEDCAEALGCTYKGRHVGTFGAAGTFSFFGNKTVTTGEGGMVVTNHARLADRLRSLKGQAQSPTQRYWHVEMGFNYRMTNIAAAIGVAQLERLASILERKQAIATQYRYLLRDTPVTFQARAPDLESAEWLVSILLPEGVDRDRIIRFMDDEAVETRPTFYCAHHMPMYAARLRLPRAEQISRRGLSLPSFPQMSKHDVERVTHVLRASLEQYGPVTRRAPERKFA